MSGQGWPDRLVAHRGWPGRYPENSRSGMRAVLEAGARFVEFDVQLTADRQALVFHDDQLYRLMGLPGRVGDLDLKELLAAPLRQPEGDGFVEEGPPSLQAMLALLSDWPTVTVFIELKRASMRRYGRDALLESVLAALHGVTNPVVLISFDSQVLERARARGAKSIGWVFKPWNERARIEAARLSPDYLFVRKDRVPAGEAPFWPGSWQWVIYDVNERASAEALLTRGADLIETDYLPELAGLAHGRT
ncbi:glycerophosphoryl diester phosphodiesterase [Natronospira proteinivora]|uniref:Glycerophosphoryl diester phosphodiesterase n=1 Tax=Natronospira proteinivora TaxID=1807133 RepID=A0ABT1GAU0_9GAMM|nr:glycerophosphodiester phosphodiesterase family protein [Natronospira proteinivora]MCP1728434.1 glycerophosphoryl diester phosphodiesterase [Natronospira proteinivora]